MTRRFLYRIEGTACGFREARFVREVRPDTLEIFDVHTRQCVGKVLEWVRAMGSSCRLYVQARMIVRGRACGYVYSGGGWGDGPLRCGEIVQSGNNYKRMHQMIVRCSFECPHVELSDGEE
jgi:hypothetical protein